MGKNLTIRMGDCNHRKYIPKLLTWIQNKSFDSRDFISHIVPLSDILEAYKHFDKREDGWLKVMLKIK